uniref:Annexin n=1 Tax=Heterodera avenae TaxID=34510 RepID=A0A059WFW2_HETAV|nr:annexin [Heterodera avenae]AIA08666.1 annexin [Heterodera avenae]
MMSNATKNILGTPTIINNVNFDPKVSANFLHKAIEEKRKDEIIHLLCTISNQQRQDLAIEFKQLFGEDLFAKLKKALSGDFEELILALLEQPAVYDAQQMHRAMSGLGTKESVLIEILVTHSNRQIAEMKRVYEQLYGHPLEKDIVGDTSGAFQRLLVSLCNESRDESWSSDPIRANLTARALFKEGEVESGVNDVLFNQVLANENFIQLHLIFEEYQKISGHPIEQAIHQNFSGETRDGYLAVVECVSNRHAFFAKVLQNSTKSFLGLGRRDTDLIRLIVTRAECDMVEIKEQYMQMFNTPLEKAIESNCSGPYKDGLLTLIKGN